MLPYAILGKTNIQLLLENAGNNAENNCKPDHNRSEIIRPLGSKRQIVQIFFNI
jgi:hypothetical protein